MKITAAERSMLINQFLLLKFIDKDDSTSHYSVEDYDNFITILFNGYEGFYDRILPQYTIPKKISDEVTEILYMYDRATISYENLSEDSQLHIEKHNVTFSGFDGNEEYNHYDIYKFMIERLGEFSHMFKNTDLDSHYPKLSRYKKQLDLFKQYKDSGDLLDFDGLIKIFG